MRDSGIGQSGTLSLLTALLSHFSVDGLVLNGQFTKIWNYCCRFLVAFGSGKLRFCSIFFLCWISICIVKKQSGFSKCAPLFRFRLISLVCLLLLIAATIRNFHFREMSSAEQMAAEFEQDGGPVRLFYFRCRDLFVSSFYHRRFRYAIVCL